jgi:hypothetical protein
MLVEKTIKFIQKRINYTQLIAEAILELLIKLILI